MYFYHSAKRRGICLKQRSIFTLITVYSDESKDWCMSADALMDT